MDRGGNGYLTGRRALFQMARAFQNGLTLPGDAPRFQTVHEESIQKLYGAVRDIPDFPKPGIIFKDITPILSDGPLLKLALEALSETAQGQKVDKVAGIDARGFIFGAAVADRLGAGFIPIRKAGKLPHTTESVRYALEYGEAEIQIHDDAIADGENILLVDDLLATGGTAAAAIHLIQKLGGNIIGAAFLIELSFLDGRKALNSGIPVTSILKY